MKFLPGDRYYNDIIPLNIIYDRGPRFGQDNLTIIYKDLSTGEKKVHIIERPMIEIYITKPEERTYTHVRNFLELDKCYPLKVHYATRFAEAAKELQLASADDAKLSPFVFGADVDIEGYYMTQFELEYHTDAKVELSLGYFDIENDTINLRRFPEYGETPINCVTYIDGSTRNVFTFVFLKSNIERFPGHTYYERLDEFEENFNDAANWLRTHLAEFIDRCHEMFDDIYGDDLEYNVLLFDEEIKLIEAFWHIVHTCDNDFIGAWNMPYDMQNMMIRPKVLGYDPDSIIPDPRCGENRHVWFKEDDNPTVHKKKHLCITYTIPTFVDDMVNYSGIRSGGAKLPSHKLNAVARNELHDEKIDYSEEGNIRTFPYEDLIKFILYNIKDTLLLLGLGRKTKDMDTIYSRMYSSMILPKAAFTTTAVVWGALKSFAYKRGLSFGPNKNRFNKNRKRIDYGKIVTQFEDDDPGDIYLDDLFFGDERDDDDDEEGGEKKREKYDGAYVANTLHMQPTGYQIMGAPAKYVHRNVADEDITSEYPTAVIIMNASNETLVGRVFLEEPSKFQIPIYASFKFRGDDADKYKLDVSNFMLEAYSERDVFTFTTIFLNLPEPDVVLSALDSIIDELEE